MNLLVSIPRSEFCLFGPYTSMSMQTHGACFNSPLGILFVRTLFTGDKRWRGERVSIPRSEFCLFGPQITYASGKMTVSFNSPLGILFVRTDFSEYRVLNNEVVSIPRSEFCLFGLAKTSYGLWVC